MPKLVVMGVAGSGKSTLAGELARALACPLIEGDAHHPAASRDKMRSGVALQDADREPWLDALGRLVAASEGSAVLTCSALKRRYRERLRAFQPGLVFIHLEIDPALAQARVAGRAGHFFPASVVASQFKDLEPPVGEARVLGLDADMPLAEQSARVLQWLTGQASDPPGSLANARRR
jgi:gluconokinase